LTPDPEVPGTPPASLPVAAIGSSAGGLEALSELLETLPAKTGLAYLLVSHLDPKHESLLPEILQKKTRIPVTQAQDQMEIVADHIYVIAPNTVMTLSGKKLQVTARESGAHMPVNALLHSLAKECGGCAVAVILSGTGTDGTEGIKSIKEAAGIVFVQDPTSARFAGMPQSAIQTGCADMVLPARDIGRELGTISAHPYIKQGEPPPDSDSRELTEHALAAIFRLLAETHRTDFTQYKSSTIMRRLRRRMALRNIAAIRDYANLLKEDPEELAALYDDLLIRVTSFFRDPDTFAGLANRAFPAICEGRTQKDPIRIWVPGCATGEEVYSIAIALLEFLGERAGGTRIQIFGTDLSAAAIAHARTGRYPESIAERVSAERLQRFFVRDDHHYCIAKSVRDLCIFAPHNVARDPPFSRIDLVSCCNVLIYLGSSLQRQVMLKFHYALKPKGFLTIGPAENIGPSSPYFELADRRSRLYTRQPVATRMQFESDIAASTSASQGGTSNEAAYSVPSPEQVQRQADSLLLSRFAPASVVVDARMNIIQFRGQTSPYIEHAGGAASLNLHRVARAGILVQLLPAIQEAHQSGQTVKRENLRVETPDAVRQVNLEVVPLKDATGASLFSLILFDTPGNTGHRARSLPEAAISESDKDRYILQLERELADMREYLRGSNEAHEAAEEEAKAAQEELLSANEEFQSTNEELETAKEELQSANEELTTTNDELLTRAHELGVLNGELQSAQKDTQYARAYADAIIDTAAQPLLVLDAGLVVQRANRTFYENFQTTPAQTLNRRIFELGDGQWNIEGLSKLLEKVLSSNMPLQNYQVTHDFPSLGPTTMLLHASRLPGVGERPTLILLAIEDISKAAETGRQRETADRRKDEFLAMLAHELRNPLAPVRNALYIMHRTVKEDDTRRHLAMMDRQVTLMTRLVDDLMDISRITRGRVGLERALVDLRVLVPDAVAAAKPSLDTRSHRVTVLLPPAEVPVHADPSRLEQVVGNLLNNAGKYTDPGGHITVTLERHRREAVIKVRDNGVGMPPGVIPHVFDLFMQAGGSIDRSAGGLGIGLTLVRRLVEMHGGTVEARSAGLGKGSEFEVRLPLSADRGVSQEARRTAEEQHPFQVRRILVVDDNVDSTQSVAELARMWGHEAVQAYDGVTALEVARSFRPDVALLDIGLPSIDGYTLARELRKLPDLEPLYLMAMTGYGQPGDREAAKNAGFDRHLIKPLQPDQLQKLLATLPRVE
jgi:two-component system CheB/CheR fusion protein